MWCFHIQYIATTLKFSGPPAENATGITGQIYAIVWEKESSIYATTTFVLFMKI